MAQFASCTIMATWEYPLDSRLEVNGCVYKELRVVGPGLLMRLVDGDDFLAMKSNGKNNQGSF